MTLDEAKEELKAIYENALALQAEISNIEIKVSQANDANHILNAVNNIVMQNQWFYQQPAAPIIPSPVPQA